MAHRKKLGRQEGEEGGRDGGRKQKGVYGVLQHLYKGWTQN